MNQNNGEISNNSEKKKVRGSIRVAVNFPLSFTPISEKEFGDIKDTFCAHTTSDREGRPSLRQDLPSLNDMEKEMEETLGQGFLQMWRLIDHKLNLIYSTLMKESFGEWEREGICVELGGWGLKLVDREGVVKSGDRLKMRISPLTYPPFSIVVLGTVQRAENKENEHGDPLCEAAVAFDTINRDDQEGLIAYLFKRQREIIRSGND